MYFVQEDAGIGVGPVCRRYGERRRRTGVVRRAQIYTGDPTEGGDRLNQFLQEGRRCENNLGRPIFRGGRGLIGLVDKWTMDIIFITVMTTNRVFLGKDLRKLIGSLLYDSSSDTVYRRGGISFLYCDLL